MKALKMSDKGYLSLDMFLGGCSLLVFLLLFYTRLLWSASVPILVIRHFTIEDSGLKERMSGRHQYRRIDNDDFRRCRPASIVDDGASNVWVASCFATASISFSIPTSFRGLP